VEFAVLQLLEGSFVPAFIIFGEVNFPALLFLNSKMQTVWLGIVCSFAKEDNRMPYETRNIV
jgi:hypothetical protein